MGSISVNLESCKVQILTPSVLFFENMKKQHYHGLLAPCPYTKYKKFIPKIALMNGKYIDGPTMIQMIPCNKYETR